MQPLATLNATRSRAVAQYLRMSTEHQRYSIPNQMLKLAEYATQHNMDVVRTYADHGRSGLDAHGRREFVRMISEVECGQVDFEAILVFDVSRWGRFQNTDESAHYDFLCRRAGVRVIYCFEGFREDDGPFGIVLRNLRRFMDGEYSRQLSVKVSLSQTRYAALGYFQGGSPGYGLRRQLVDSNGSAKYELKAGERKALHEDKVVLVPGPACEIMVLNQIFHLFVHEGQTHQAIADRLNAAGTPGEDGRKWTRSVVRTVLGSERYLENLVYNRRSTKLKQPPLTNRPEQWTRRDGVFPSLVPVELFDKAQRLLHLGSGLTDQEMIDLLGELGERHSKVSAALINRQRHMPCARTYLDRFGSLPTAYALAGIATDRDFSYINERRSARLSASAACHAIAEELRELDIHVAVNTGSMSLDLAGKRVALRAIRCTLDRNGYQRWRRPAEPAQRCHVIVFLRLAHADGAVHDHLVMGHSHFGSLPTTLGLSTAQMRKEVIAFENAAEVARYLVDSGKQP